MIANNMSPKSKFVFRLFFILLIVVMMFGTAAMFTLKWSVQQIEDQLAMKLNQNDALKVENVKIFPELKKIVFRNSVATLDRLTATIPEIDVTIDMDYFDMFRILRNRKMDDLHLKINFHDFVLENVKLSKKKTLANVPMAVDFEVKIRGTAYQIAIHQIKIDKMFEGEATLEFQGKPLKIFLSKQFKSELQKFFAENQRDWQSLELKALNGSTRNLGVSQMVLQALEIDLTKLNLMMKAGVHLMSNGNLSEGERISKEAMTAAYHFMNSENFVRFSMQPKAQIPVKKIVANLQSKMDLGVGDLGVRLWVNQ